MKKNRHLGFVPVREFPGYSVSIVGDVWSDKTNRFLKPAISTPGYLRVSLCRNGMSKYFDIHRLVAKTYITNPENKPCVNHIDGNKKNNITDNLEWVTHKENSKHAHRNGLTPRPPDNWTGKFGAKHNRSKGVYQIDIKTLQRVGSYGSQLEAFRMTGILNTGISDCCSGKLKTFKGFIWKYKK